MRASCLRTGTAVAGSLPSSHPVVFRCSANSARVLACTKQACPLNCLSGRKRIWLPTLGFGAAPLSPFVASTKPFVAKSPPTRITDPPQLCTRLQRYIYTLALASFNDISPPVIADGFRAPCHAVDTPRQRPALFTLLRQIDASYITHLMSISVNVQIQQLNVFVHDRPAGASYRHHPVHTTTCSTLGPYSVRQNQNFQACLERVAGKRFVNLEYPVPEAQRKAQLRCINSIAPSRGGENQAVLATSRACSSSAL